MAIIYIEKYSKGGRPLWQYASSYGKSGRICRVDPITNEIHYYDVKGIYAPKRLEFLSDNARQWIYDKLEAEELIQYAENFEDEMQEKVTDMFMAMQENNTEYREAQAVGDFELAAGLANNDMETAKQVIMREYVYSL